VTFAAVYLFVAAELLAGSPWSGVARFPLAALPLERINQV
jgi:hypothetical protein